MKNDGVLKNENLNIPNLSVQEIVQSLAGLYSQAVGMGMPLSSLPTPFLWGPAGVGKSEGVRQLAQKLEETTGKRVTVTDVRLLLFSPIDLRGIPVPDAEKQFANWLRPRIFAMDPGADTLNLLFLDELSAAPQSVQAAAYQICLDRRVGEHAFPENCIVIAGGNRTSDKSVAYAMPKALCNRLMHFNVKSDLESWRAWAVRNRIDARILGYLSFDHSRLCVAPETSDLAYPTPRSWAFASRLLQETGESPKKIHHLLAACLGTDTALALEQWCDVYRELPDVEQILCGTCKTYPSQQQVLHALIASLIAVLRERGERLTQREVDACCAYVSHFPPDFALVFYKDASQLDNAHALFMCCSVFQHWFSKNKRLMRGNL